MWCGGVSLVLSRSANIYHYKKKSERDKDKRRNSLEWAEPILKDRQQQESCEGTEGGDRQPHMLHVVYLVKKIKGRPWWEKQIIEQLQLEGKVQQQQTLSSR